MKQSDKELIGYWLRRYLTEYLPVVRNLSRNTITSYRDALRQLLEYVTENGLSPDKLRVEEITSELVASFLLNLERAKNCSIQTRNQRLSAIHSFANYISTPEPEKPIDTPEIPPVIEEPEVDDPEEDIDIPKDEEQVDEDDTYEELKQLQTEEEIKRDNSIMNLVLAVILSGIIGVMLYMVYNKNIKEVEKNEKGKEQEKDEHIK